MVNGYGQDGTSAIEVVGMLFEEQIEPAVEYCGFTAPELKADVDSAFASLLQKNEMAIGVFLQSADNREYLTISAEQLTKTRSAMVESNKYVLEQIKTVDPAIYCAKFAEGLNSFTVANLVELLEKSLEDYKVRETAIPGDGQ